MARPKKSEARDTRREILDAALDLFAQTGFFGTSTRQIARRVGVRESALYHHFPSKAAILQGLLEELGPGRAAMVDSLDVVGLAQAMGVRELMRSLVHLLITEWAAPREMKLMRVMVGEGYRLKAEGIISPWENIQRVRGVVAGVFQKLMGKKLIRRVDAQAAAVAFVAPLTILRLMHLGLVQGAPDVKLMLAEADRQLDFFLQNLELQNDRSAVARRR